ncbi:MAG: hypothetical protein J2P16_00070 [Mycobacterium sp.]|nr:hypothetical protein [Mycobacterium sp.]
MSDTEAPIGTNPEPARQPQPDLLDPDTLDDIRTWIGSTPDDAAVTVTFDRQRTVERTAYVILKRRLADLLTSPTSFTVPGDWSQSTEGQIAQLRTQLEQLAWAIGDPTLGPPIATMVRLARRDATRGWPFNRWEVRTGDPEWTPGGVAW